MSNREQFEAAWHKEYPLHSSTAFTRSGFDADRYTNTRVQDGWLMWQAARATPADSSLSLTDMQLMILKNSSFRLYASGQKRASLKLDAVIAEISVPPADHSDIEQYVLSVLPSIYYMDPPDGGDVSVLEQLRRMADEAAKYRAMVKAPQPGASASSADAISDTAILHIADAVLPINKGPSHAQIIEVVRRCIAASAPKESK